MFTDERNRGSSGGTPYDRLKVGLPKAAAELLDDILTDQGLPWMIDVTPENELHVALLINKGLIEEPADGKFGEYVPTPSTLEAYLESFDDDEWDSDPMVKR